MIGGPVSQVKEYLRQFAFTGANLIDTLDDGKVEVSLRASDLQALIEAAEAVAREQRAYWATQYASEDADELAVEEISQLGVERPLLSVVTRSRPNAVDLEVPEQIALALMAKGWTPPEPHLYCPPRVATPRKHDFLPHTRTCLHCGAHEKAATHE